MRLIQAPAVLLVLAAVLISLNLIGFPWYVQSGNHWGGNHFGWPLTYCSGPWTETQATEAVEYRQYIHHLAPFKGFISPVLGPWVCGVEEIYVSRLILNMLLCAGIMAVVSLPLIRFANLRGNKWTQLSIPTLLVATAAIALFICAALSRYVHYHVWRYRHLIYFVLCAISLIAIMVCLAYVPSRQGAEP